MSDDERGMSPAAIEAIVREHTARAGALLPILHEIQDQCGYVPDAAVSIIAKHLNLSRAEVHGVVSFYHFFRTTPPGSRTIYLCRAEACQAMGARSLEKYLQEKLGIDFHETTPDGQYSLEPVYCLGNCACSPSLMIDETVHGRVSASRIDALLDGVQ